MEEDGHQPVREVEWARDIEEILVDVFNNPQSNFASAIRQFFLGLCAYGTGVLMMEEDADLPYKVFFKNVDVRQCYFEEDPRGLVNVIYRNFKMPVYRVIQAFEAAADPRL